MNKVVVVGSLSMDVTAFADALPGPGETVLGTRYETMPGGKGQNQAIAAARAGADTLMIGCVGRDAFGDEIADGLSREGISIDRLARVDGPTGIAHIRVNAAGQNDIVVVPLANSRLTPELVEEGLRGVGHRGDVLLLQLEVPFESVMRAVEVGNELGMRVILDPAPAPPTGALPADLWGGLYAVVPNESEAAAITGEDTSSDDGVLRAAAKLAEMGVENPLLTLGERGALLDGQLLRAPKVKAVDTTAAGDVFAGYLGAGLAEGQDLVGAIRSALAAGSLAVTKVGASASVPQRSEVDAMLESS